MINLTYMQCIVYIHAWQYLTKITHAHTSQMLIHIYSQRPRQREGEGISCVRTRGLSSRWPRRPIYTALAQPDELIEGGRHLIACQARQMNAWLHTCYACRTSYIHGATYTFKQQLNLEGGAVNRVIRLAKVYMNATYMSDL